MTNEKLIKEIETLLDDAPITNWVDGGALTDSRQLARDIVAVFEKRHAQTPPDGWFYMGSHVDAPWVSVEFSEEVDETGLPLWERPIEPAATDAPSRATPTAAEGIADERARVLAILADMDYNDGGMMRWSSGRPTDQAEKVADRIVRELAGFRRSVVPEPSAEPTENTRYRWAGGKPPSEDRKQQREPSDAQIEAALHEWWYGEHEDTWESKMRAALRAAGGAR